MKASANIRNSESRVSLQNFRKKTPQASEAVAITPIRKPSTFVALPNQAIQQNQHCQSRGQQTVAVEINVRKDDEINENQEVRERKKITTAGTKLAAAVLYAYA